MLVGFFTIDTTQCNMTVLRFKLRINDLLSKNDTHIHFKEPHWRKLGKMHDLSLQLRPESKSTNVNERILSGLLLLWRHKIRWRDIFPFETELDFGNFSEKRNNATILIFYVLSAKTNRGKIVQQPRCVSSTFSIQTRALNFSHNRRKFQLHRGWMRSPVSNCRHLIPSVWGIQQVRKRLIMQASRASAFVVGCSEKNYFFLIYSTQKRAI